MAPGTKPVFGSSCVGLDVVGNGLRTIGKDTREQPQKYYKLRRQ